MGCVADNLVSRVEEIKAPVFTESDKRLSAKYIGGGWAIVVFTVFALIFFHDIPKLYRHLKYGTSTSKNQRGRDP